MSLPIEELSSGRPHLNQVFKTSGPPEFLYIERPAARDPKGRTYGALVESILRRNGIVVVAGPKGTGKTWLSLRVIQDLGLIPVLVACTMAKSEKDIWTDAIAELGEAAMRTRGTELSKENTTEWGAESGPGTGLLAGFLGKFMAKRATKTGTKHVLEAPLEATNGSTFLRRSATGNYILVVDEFHLLTSLNQESIAQQLKEFATRGRAAVVISSSGADPRHASEDLVRVADRVELNYWTEDELRNLASEGLKLLNVEIDDAGLRHIASQCVGRPDLIHRVCRELLSSRGLEEWSDTPVRLKLEFSDLAAALRVVAQERFRQDSVMQQGLGRLRAISQEIPAHASMCERVLTAIGEGGFVAQISVDELEERLERNRTGGQPPVSTSELVQLLTVLCADPPQKGEPLLVWDEEKGVVRIPDPELIFYLRWREAATGRQPLLEGMKEQLRVRGGTSS